MTGAPSKCEPGREIAADLVEKFLKGRAAMVSSDVVMNISPKAFDAVLLRAVRRKEVEQDLLPDGSEEGLHQLALVDGVVVQDEVDPADRPVDLQERAEQVEEQPDRLAATVDTDNPSGSWIVSSGDESLLIPAGRKYEPLMSREHPVSTDAWVQVNIDFVGVKDDLVVAGIALQFPELADAAETTGGTPRASHDWLGTPPAHLQLPQDSPQMADRDLNPKDFGGHASQEFQRPAGSLEPEGVRCLQENLPQALTHILVDFPGSVLGSAIIQRGFIFDPEPRYDPGSGRGNTTDFPSRRSSGESLVHLEKDATADAQIGVAGLAVEALQTPSSGARKSEPNSHRGTSLCSGLVCTSRDTGEVSRCEAQNPKGDIAFLDLN
jgi:hypothetical protein